MGTALDGLRERQAKLDAEIQKLVYERYQLTRRTEQIDEELIMLNAAAATNSLTRKDLDTEAVIAEARQSENLLV